jgi:hypothetical protein
MELWRRLILLAFTCAAIWLAKFAFLAPLVLVEYADFEERRKEAGTYMGVRIMTEEKQRLSAMPLHDYISEVTKDRLIKGEGKDWEELFTNGKAITEGKRVSKEWSRRLPSDPYPMKVLFFRADEPPVNTLSGYFKNPNDVVHVAYPRGKQTEYLELKYRVYSDDDFQFGSGLSSYPHPPSYLLYPSRKFSVWLVLIGLTAYVILPRAKIGAAAIRYPLWRIVLGDIVALLLIVPFFSFPMLIMGGSTQVFTKGWPVLLFFWPFFFLGIWLLVISAWFASYQILPLKDCLRISTYKGTRDFLFRDMAFFQPVVFKSPRWLIFMSWAAAVSGRGSARIGAAGRAMLLSSAEYGSIGIELKNGLTLYITTTDMMGTPLLKEAEGIIDTLRNAGVREKTEVKGIKSLGFETLRLP